MLLRLLDLHTRIETFYAGGFRYCIALYLSSEVKELEVKVRGWKIRRQQVNIVRRRICFNYSGSSCNIIVLSKQNRMSIFH